MNFNVRNEMGYYRFYPTEWYALNGNIKQYTGKQIAKSSTAQHYVISVLDVVNKDRFDSGYWCRLIEKAQGMEAVLKKINYYSKNGGVDLEGDGWIECESARILSYLDDTVKVECEGKKVRISRKSAEALNLI